jgi:hypothetical protein
MSVADMTGKRWVEKTHIHMAERRFGILGCRNALRRITTGGEFQTIPGRREKALHGMRNGGFEVVGLVTLRLVSCLHQCDHNKSQLGPRLANTSMTMQDRS